MWAFSGFELLFFNIFDSEKCEIEGLITKKNTVDYE